jgi:hypothetical protein
LREISKPAGSEDVSLAGDHQLDPAREDIEKALCRRGSQGSSGGELRSHLREPCAEWRCSVDYELDALGAGKG